MITISFCFLFSILFINSSTTSASEEEVDDFSIWNEFNSDKIETDVDANGPILQHSPFYTRQDQLAKLLHLLLRTRNDKQALELLKMTIEVEKKWRRRVCQIYFDVLSCDLGLRTAPFDLLKVNMVNNLRRDPTDEIISQVRSSVNKLLG